MPESNLTPNREEIQRKPMQTAESATKKSDTTRDHMMPGLVDTLVQTFNTPRKHYTIRGAARAHDDVSPDFVATALVRDLQRQILDLYRRLDVGCGRQGMHLVIGRRAA